MRVLHVIDGVDPRCGGPLYVLRNIIRRQVQAGYDVALAATNVQAVEPWAPNDEYLRRMYAEPDFSGAEVYLGRAFGRSRPWSSYAFSPQCRRWLKRRVADPRTSPDVIHIHGVFSHVISQAAALGRRRSIPYLIEPFGCLDTTCFRLGAARLKKLFMHFTLRKILLQAACVHPASQYEADQLLRWIPGNNIRVVPHGVDLPDSYGREAGWELLSRFPQLDGKRVLLFMGRIHPIKRPELIVEAMACLKSKHPNLALLMVGNDEGHMAVVYEAARKHGIEGAIVEGGFLRGELKRAAFAAADIFVQTSAHENFGVTVVEAMAHAVPALVTPGVAAHCFLDQSGAGLTVDDSPEAIAQGMETLLAGDRDAIGGRGREFVERHLTWPRVIQQFEQLYQEFMARPQVHTG